MIVAAAVVAMLVLTVGVVVVVIMPMVVVSMGVVVMVIMPVGVVVVVFLAVAATGAMPRPTTGLTRKAKHSAPGP